MSASASLSVNMKRGCVRLLRTCWTSVNTLEEKRDMKKNDSLISENDQLLLE